MTVTYTPFNTGQTSGSSGSTTTSSSSPVDTLDAQLSRMISQLATEYGTQVFNWANSTLAPNQAVTNDVVGNYMQAAQSGLSLANETQQQYTDIGAPALAALNDSAGSYSSKARQQVMAGQAEAGSMQGSQAGISSAEQQLQGFGINPNSGVYQELEDSNRGRHNRSPKYAGGGARFAAAGCDRGPATSRTSSQRTRRCIFGVGRRIKCCVVQYSHRCRSDGRSKSISIDRAESFY